MYIHSTNEKHEAVSQLACEPLMNFGDNHNHSTELSHYVTTLEHQVFTGTFDPHFLSSHHLASWM